MYSCVQQITVTWISINTNEKRVQDQTNINLFFLGRGWTVWFVYIDRNSSDFGSNCDKNFNKSHKIKYV